MKSCNQEISVLIVDGHPIIVDGLKRLLPGEEWVSSVTGVSSGFEALELLNHQEFNIVLADAFLPDMFVAEFIKKVAALFPSTRVVALTMHDDHAVVAEIINAGAAGYVLKSADFSEIYDAICKVAKGEKYLSPVIQELIMRDIYQHKSFLSKNEKKENFFTPREKQVLQLLARRHSVDEIAEKLYITSSTVEVHCRNVFAKTKTSNRSALIKYALENRLIQKG